MTEILCMMLSRDEIPRIAEIDRSEIIEHIYYHRDGQLVLEKEHWDVGTWPREMVENFEREFDLTLARGGTIFGAFDRDTLVGMASVDGKFIGDPPDQLNMPFLHVSNRYRGRGIGARLVEMVKSRARELGARRMYVSGTPSEATVRFYMGQGFKVASEVDPELFAKEPEDIHMDLTL